MNPQSSSGTLALERVAETVPCDRNFAQDEIACHFDPDCAGAELTVQQVYSKMDAVWPHGIANLAPGYPAMVSGIPAWFVQPAAKIQEEERQRDPRGSGSSATHAIVTA